MGWDFMRFSKQLVKDVIGELVGEKGIEVSNCICNEAMAEEDIAKKFKEEVKHTRNTLYELQKHNLVQFQRKRNDANGWYTYFWSLNKKRVHELHQKINEAKIEKLEYMLTVEEKSNFFSCRNECIKVDFDGVFNLNFCCPECGLHLEQYDNKKRVKQIKDKIKDIKLCIN
jgi:transcription initiation factor TFIIE subunit alpha